MELSFGQQLESSGRVTVDLIDRPYRDKNYVRTQKTPKHMSRKRQFTDTFFNELLSISQERSDVVKYARDAKPHILLLSMKIIYNSALSLNHKCTIKNRSFF